MEYLAQLANPRLCRPGKTDPDPLDYAVHFLFDDTALADAPERAVGYFLHDLEEVQVIAEVVAALDRVFDAHGTTQADSFYLQQPEWESGRIDRCECL